MPELRRPCPPETLVPLAPVFKAAWGPGQPFDVEPWEDTASAVGFEVAFTVRVDDDWDARHFVHRSAEPYRYVLVPLGGDWVLRAGRTELAAIHAGTGGRHDHMLSAAEVAAAGGEIRAGWIYEIADDHIRVD